MFLDETSRRFDLSSRSLGHVLFSSAGEAQGTNTGWYGQVGVFLETFSKWSPTGVGDHCNASGHSVSLDNTKVVTREPQWTKRKVKEAI